MEVKGVILCMRIMHLTHAVITVTVRAGIPEWDVEVRTDNQHVVSVVER